MFEGNSIEFLSDQFSNDKIDRQTKEIKHDKKKKEKKEKSKKRDRKEYEADLVHAPNEILASSLVSNAPSEAIPIAIEKSSTKVSFFAQLKAAEASKPAIGTIHANAARMEKEAIKNGVGEWVCGKCNTTNIKYNVTCEKCHAMKRLKEYR